MERQIYDWYTTYEFIQNLDYNTKYNTWECELIKNIAKEESYHLRQINLYSYKFMRFIFKYIRNCVNNKLYY